MVFGLIENKDNNANQRIKFMSQITQHGLRGQIKTPMQLQTSTGPH